MYTASCSTATRGQYTASDFVEACERVGVTQSMGRVGSAYDNAVVESWHSTLEFELLSRQRFATKAEARKEVARYIDRYNTTRRHSSCQMLPPVAYEALLVERLANGDNDAAAA